jgi:hypothetical protein
MSAANWHGFLTKRAQTSVQTKYLGKPDADIVIALTPRKANRMNKHLESARTALRHLPITADGKPKIEDLATATHRAVEEIVAYLQELEDKK